MISERRAKRLKKRKKRIISIILIIFIVLIGYFLVNNQFIKGLYYKAGNPISDNNPIITLNESISPKFIRFKNVLITTSGNNITAYNIKGEQVEFNKFSTISASVSHYNNLNLKACDDYVIAYDKGGVGAIVFNKNKITATINTNSKIIFAKPFNNGEFLVIAEDSNAKNQVILYSYDGKEKFKWHSGVNNILDATYSAATNKLVIVTSELSTGIFNSKIIFFDISNADPYSEMTFENTFFTNINFYNKNNIIVLSDIGTYYFNVNGELINSYNFNNKMLTCYKQLSNGSIALSFGSKSGNGTVVEVVNNKGNLVGSYESEYDILNIDSDNGNILICSLREVVLLSKNGMLLRKIDYNKDLQKAFFLKNKFVLIGNSEIRIVN